MVGVVVGSDTSKIIILGHGLTIPERFELEAGIFIEPTCPPPDLNDAAKSCKNFSDYSAVVTGCEIANFSLEVHGEGGKALAAKAWNSLWHFHLLSLACGAPCYSLYSVAVGSENVYHAANRNLILRSSSKLATATTAQLQWAKRHSSAFNQLISHPEFSTAMRCYGNSHYLFDLDTRIMLLWAGIEGLLSVDAELSRRIALYAAIMLDGTPEQKAAYFNEVKQAYSIRSRAVHGAKVPPGKLEQGYEAACRILSRLLARCVELGRVPSPAELDRLAASQAIH